MTRLPQVNTRFVSTLTAGTERRNGTDEPPISVVIIDDHAIFRYGLRAAIASDPRFELVGEAGSGDVALKMIREQQPQVAVLDLSLPVITGLDVAQTLRSAKCQTRLVVMTSLKDEHVFNEAINLGIIGYLLKESAASELISCLASVAEGIPYVSPLLTSFLLRRRSRGELLEGRSPGLDSLTQTECRILKSIAQKKTTKEIAADLFISPRTVESHRARICAKLALKGPNSLLQFALERREVPSPF